MQETNYIITGSSGYIGSNFLLKNPKTLTVNRDTENLFLQDSNRNILEDNKNKYVLIHLATHFSINKDDDHIIKKANLDFGINLLKYIEKLNISKIVYTNTMYSFYKGEKERNSFYTKSKNIFSKHLFQYTQKRNIFYEEIFLDNSFGGIDRRKKVIPLIIENIFSNKENPINNPNNVINLMHIDDIVKRLELSGNIPKSEKSAFINNKSVALYSIYEFLDYYKKTKKIKKDILKFYENEYIPNDLAINYKNLKINDLSNKLIHTYKNYEKMRNDN